MLKRYNSFVKRINESNESDESFINDVPNNEVKKFNAMTDYTLLEPSATEDNILELSEKARIIEPKSICILPKMVKFVKEVLKDTNILICTVISFPEGTNSLEEKVKETEKALSDGADEIDMVLDYQKLLENWDDQTQSLDKKEHDYLLQDIKQLADLCHKQGKILKVIVESGELDIPQTKYVTTLCIDGGADYIKTSTGKVDIGAELDKVKVMNETITEEGSDLLIKASGGIRTIDDQRKFFPFVQRFGVGSGSVDNINGLTQYKKENY